MDSFYLNWMKYIKPETKLRDIVFPGSHNAATAGMSIYGHCQNDDLFTQYSAGIRAFDFRFHVKNGKAVVEHGIEGGAPLATRLAEFRRAMECDSDRFLFIDARFSMRADAAGIIKVEFEDNHDHVNSLLSRYLEPDKYALTGADVPEMTLGEFRETGKRYIFNISDPRLVGATDARISYSWSERVNGLKPENFIRETLATYAEAGDGMFLHFIQRTPNIGSEVGMTPPEKLERDMLPYYDTMFDLIAADPQLLGRANLMLGDYMTGSQHKIDRILALNVIKGNVLPEYEKYFRSKTF